MEMTYPLFYFAAKKTSLTLMTQIFTICIFSYSKTVPDKKKIEISSA